MGPGWPVPVRTQVAPWGQGEPNQKAQNNQNPKFDTCLDLIAFGVEDPWVDPHPPKTDSVTKKNGRWG